MELQSTLPWDGMEAAPSPPNGMPRLPRGAPRFRPRGVREAALRCGERGHEFRHGEGGIYRHMEG